MRILIVDDDPMVVESCRRILSAEGHHLTVAENAESAESILASEASVDLMLTDIKMPKRAVGTNSLRHRASIPTAAMKAASAIAGPV